MAASCVSCGMWIPKQGLNPGPLHWECGVPPTGPPGKSPSLLNVFMSLLLEGIYFRPHFRARETGVQTGEETASKRIPELGQPKQYETNQQRKCTRGR